MADINEILSRYTRSGDLIPAMQEIQKAFGYLSEEHLQLLAARIGVPLSQVSGVASFYSMFKTKPVANHTISICRGTACHVHNSEGLLKHVEKKLNIKAGEKTRDMKIGLECVNCIGACAKAPAMMINDTVYGELDEHKIDKIIETLK